MQVHPPDCFNPRILEREMPTQLTDIIYGKNKKIDFAKFNIGSLTKAVTYDLEEFGDRGVQGLVIKTQDADRAISYSTGANLKAPYIMAGVCKGDLVLVVCDDKNAKYEQMAVLVKGYVGIKKELAESTGIVVNAQKGDDTIDGASERQGNKFGTSVQDKGDTDFGDATGNLLICAHGTPQVNAGRVIGTELGSMTPKEVADLLTKNKDKSKRLSKGYNGKITLSGCFTASGGPEALKQDDPFAKKVWDELKKRGYPDCSVVGIPGLAGTAYQGSEDDNGKRLKEGDKVAWTNSQHTLEALEKKADELRSELDKLVDGLVKAGEKFAGDKGTFLASEGAKKVLVVVAQKERALNSVKEEIEKVLEEQKKYGKNGKMVASVMGNFGLRVIKSALGR